MINWLRGLIGLERKLSYWERQAAVEMRIEIVRESLAFNCQLWWRFANDLGNMDLLRRIQAVSAFNHKLISATVKSIDEEKGVFKGFRRTALYDFLVVARYWKEEHKKHGDRLVAIQKHPK